MNNKVTRLRQLLSEAVPVAPVKSFAESEAWRAYQYLHDVPPQLEQRWQDKAIREINRIGVWYGWGSVIQQCLDTADVLYVSSLCDDQLESLLKRMKSYEDCLQTGCGAPDAPPAW